MENRDLISTLDDERIDELMKYAPVASKQNFENIKNRFFTVTEAKSKSRPKKHIFIALLPVAVLLMLSVFVYAGVIDLNRIYQKAFGDSAGYISQYGEIIDGGNEYDGIKLNLLSTIKDDETLLIFFSLTDITDDRLSPTMDLYDSWFLDQGFGGNCKLLDYEPDKKTASFMITSVGASTNKTAVLTISSFLKSLEFKSDFEENEIDIASALSENNPQTVDFDKVVDGYGMGIAPDSKYNNDEVLHNLKLLLPDQSLMTFSTIDWSVISNIGFVDGELHIQTNPSNDNFSNIMSMSFVDSGGKRVYTNEMSISYGKYERAGRTVSGDYDEFIFESISDISQTENLTLVLDVAEYGEYYEGKWQAVFKVPSPVTKLVVPGKNKLTLAGEEITADKIVLSPLGLTIQYKAELYSGKNDQTDEAYVTYDDGTVINFSFTSRGAFDNNVTCKFSDPIIEIEKVRSININGYEFAIDMKK